MRRKPSRGVVRSARHFLRNDSIENGQHVGSGDLSNLTRAPQRYEALPQDPSRFRGRFFSVKAPTMLLDEGFDSVTEALQIMTAFPPNFGVDTEADTAQRFGSQLPCVRQRHCRVTTKRQPSRLAAKPVDQNERFRARPRNANSKSGKLAVPQLYPLTRNCSQLADTKIRQSFPDHRSLHLVLLRLLSG